MSLVGEKRGPEPSLRPRPSEQARELHPTRATVPPAAPLAAPLTPAEAAERRQLHARAANDVQTLQAFAFPSLPPLPPPPPPRADVENSLRGNPQLWAAYQKLTPQQREVFLNLGQASWSPGFPASPFGPAQPPGPHPGWSSLLLQERLGDRDSQGHTLLDNLESLRQQRFSPGLQGDQVLREALAAMGPSNPLGGPNPVPLAQQKPSEYVRLLAGLASPEGRVRLANGTELERPAGGTGFGLGFLGATGMLTQALHAEAARHRGSVPLAARQQAVRSSLEARPEAWRAFQALSADDQSRFLELADSQALKDSLYLNDALGLKAQAPMDANLVHLLQAGRLGERDSQGHSVMENLLSLRNQELAPGMQADTLLASALQALAGTTPGPASPAAQLAQRRPAEFLRLLSGLASPSGQASLGEGAGLRRTGLAGPFTPAVELVDASLRQGASGLATGARQDERRQALRQQLQENRAFQALSPEQQQRFLAVADHPRAAQQAELYRQLGLDAPPAPDPHLLQLLDQGRLGARDSQGHTLLDNLGTLADQAYPAPLDSSVLTQVMADLADPYSIHQGNRGTCGATSLQFLLARTDPAEYARLMAGVTSQEGRVRLRGGQSLVRRPEWLQSDNSGRPDASRILQCCLMDLADGEHIDYDNDGPGHHTPRLGDIRLSPRQDGGGLYDTELSQAAQQVLGRPVSMVRPGGGLLGPALTRMGVTVSLAQGPMLVLLRWPSRELPNSGHFLVVERIENGQVYLRNPWGGQADQGSDGRDGTPVRQPVPGGAGGQIQMTEEEFYRTLASYAAPGAA